MKKLLTVVVATLLATSLFASGTQTRKNKPSGPFITAGISTVVFDWEFSQYGMAYTPKFNIKFGRSSNLPNVVTGVGWKFGADYNMVNGWFGYLKNSMSNTWLKYDGFHYQQIQVPAIARLNLVHKPGRTFFIGAGATFNWAFSAEYIHKEDMTAPTGYDDINMMNPTNIEYTAQIGWRIHNAEFFIYANYYGTSPFNTEYMSTAIPEYYQANSAYFNNKLTFGISGIMYFGLN